MAELVTNIFEKHQSQADQKGVIISYHLDPKLPVAICSDRMKLTQILTNLINNAIKFTPKSKKVNFKVTGDQETVTFMVNDEGIGIPKNRQDAIFEMFEQADNSMTRQFGGAGLGLAISKKLAEVLGGKIQMTSEEGLGSNFHLIIPYKEASLFVEEKKNSV